MDVLALVSDEAKRRGLSERTISTYFYCISTFLKKLNKEPNFITKYDIRTYIDSLIARNCSGNTLNVHVNALRFLFQEILNKPIVKNITYSKTPQRLPTVLTQEEVQRLFTAITNPKHQLMIELLYASGIRVSELTHLKAEDLNLQKKLGWVRQGKGKKDRIFIIAEKLIEKIKVHLQKENVSDGYLFKGRNGCPLHIRTVQEIIKYATKKAGIKKSVHPHTLRHSFATHLIENGYDVASVQSLLGHASMKTTMVYVHMADPRLTHVKSPFDELHLAQA